MRKLLATIPGGVAVLLLASCSQAPSTPAPEIKTDAAPKEAPPPSGPVSAKTAFYEMYKPARAWAPDFAVLSFASKEVAGIPSADGKFGMWTGVFVSPGRNEARTFTYSAADSGTIRKGVSDQGGQVWGGATSASRPFQSMEWTVDSDAAYQTAFAKAESWVKKHPGKKAAFTLANASRFPTPVWYLLWGDKASGYGIVVSAVTGTVVNAK